MIGSYAELRTIIEADPNLDPQVFWARVGVEADLVMLYARSVSNTLGLPFGALMAAFETGAVIAEAGLKEKQS